MAALSCEELVQSALKASSPSMPPSAAYSASLISVFALFACNPRSTVLCLSTAKHGKALQSTAKHSKARQSTAQHSTAQHSTTQQQPCLPAVMSATMQGGCSYLAASRAVSWLRCLLSLVRDPESCTLKGITHVSPHSCIAVCKSVHPQGTGQIWPGVLDTIMCF